MVVKGDYTVCRKKEYAQLHKEKSTKTYEKFWLYTHINENSHNIQYYSN